MKEYIEREAAIAACFDGFADCRDDCADNIRSIPAADVRPGVKAQWNGAPAILYPGYVCTCCGRFVSQKENYCPRCGAVMEQNTNSERSSNNVWWQRSEYKAESHFELCEKENGQQNTKEVDAIEELKELLDEANHNYELAVEDAERLTQMIEKNAQPRWIPVTERLPEKNQIVVAAQAGKTWDFGQFRGLAYLGGDKRKWTWKNNTVKTVDYWMPKKSALPEPPKEG